MKTLSITVIAVCIWIIQAQPISAQGADIPTAVAVGSDSIIYVIGTSMSSAGNMEYLTIAYDYNGRLQGSQRLPGNSSGPSAPVSVRIDGMNIFVSGTSPTASTGFDILTALYLRSMLVSTDQPDRGVTQFRLEQSYPNPVTGNREAVITYSIPTSGHVRLYVTDVSGKEVTTLVDEFKVPGVYNAIYTPGLLPSGTYFYVLSSEALTEVRKLAVVR